MAENTGITWCRSTRNFWSGCTKVGPGCDGCYAEAFQRWVRGKDEASGEATNWGPGRARVPHIEGAIKDLRKWNRKGGEEKAAGLLWQGRPGYWPVFLNSQSDTFDNEVPHAWRLQVWGAIEECTNLTFFLVTKRVGNVASMVPAKWLTEGFPPHVRLIITVVNQAEADRDIPKLLALPCKNGISYEPAIEAVDFSEWMFPVIPCESCPCPDPRASDEGLADCCREPDLGDSRLHWIIIGGESDQSSHVTRPFDVEWGMELVASCKASKTPVFVKQLGSHVLWNGMASFPEQHWPDGTLKNDNGNGRFRIMLREKSGANLAEWPEDLRVQEFPA